MSGSQRQKFTRRSYIKAVEKRAQGQTSWTLIVISNEVTSKNPRWPGENRKVWARKCLEKNYAWPVQIIEEIRRKEEIKKARDRTTLADWTLQKRSVGEPERHQLHRSSWLPSHHLHQPPLLRKGSATPEAEHGNWKIVSLKPWQTCHILTMCKLQFSDCSWLGLAWLL